MKTHPSIPNNIPWSKIARYFAGESPEEEAKEVGALLKRFPEISEYVNVMQQMRDHSKLRGQEYDTEAEWLKLAQHLGITNENAKQPYKSVPSSYLRSRSSINQFVRIAAVILVLIGVPYLIYNLIDTLSTTSTQQLTMREVTTERGQRIRLKFVDGTTVLLNASSSIRFPEKLGNGSREVHLQGEAYFDVARMENSPFVVYAGDTRIQVLGTGFNVKAWPDEKSVEVVLARGKVAVRSEKAQEAKEVVLAPGQKVEVPKGMAPSDPEIVELDKHLAWLDGRLVFEKAALSDVLKQLERTYDLSFRVSDSSLFARRLTATFSKDQSLNEILKSISIAINTDVSQSGRVVTLGTLKPKPVSKEDI